MVGEKNKLPETSNYTPYISLSDSDPEWDQFILNTPDGHYTQSALWSTIKAVQGWSPLRLILKDERGILGGAQILTRKLPLFGLMGYISKGPICRTGNPNFNEIIIQEIFKVCKEKRITYLSIQPPDHGDHIVPTLLKMGMKKNSQGDLEKPATILINLRPDEKTIMSSIKSNKRKHIRSSQKQGFTFREGNREDLEIFSRLHTTTGERDQFETQSSGFFEKLWDAFEPLGYAYLFIEELDGEPLIAKLSITYKDVFQNFRIGWSGEHSHKYPNEGIMWYTILWAKTHGYSFYDLGGIETRAAQTLLSERRITKSIKDTYTEYKLHYSENVVLYPETYEKIFNPIIFWIYQLFNASPQVRRAVKNIYKLTRRR